MALCVSLHHSLCGTEHTHITKLKCRVLSSSELNKHRIRPHTFSHILLHVYIHNYHCSALKALNANIQWRPSLQHRITDKHYTSPLTQTNIIHGANIVCKGEMTTGLGHVFDTYSLQVTSTVPPYYMCTVYMYVATFLPKKNGPN